MTNTGRRVQLGPDGVPPLPYVAPFTVCVPEVLGLVRKFIMDRWEECVDRAAEVGLYAATTTSSKSCSSKTCEEVQHHLAVCTT